jgi:hypothetical protein
MSLESRVRILEAKFRTDPPPPSVPVVIQLDSGEYSWQGQNYTSTDDVPGSEHGILIIEVEDGRLEANKQERS